MNEFLLVLQVFALGCPMLRFLASAMGNTSLGRRYLMTPLLGCVSGTFKKSLSVKGQTVTLP